MQSDLQLHKENQIGTALKAVKQIKHSTLEIKAALREDGEILD